MSGEPPALGPTVLAELYAHAREGYPEEVCGMLLVDGGEVSEVRRCANQQNRYHQADPQRFPRDARTAYAFSPADALALARDADGAQRVRVIYHSHVDVGAYFSAEDRAAATFDDQPIHPHLDYLVIDVRRDAVRGARLFRFAAGQFVAIAEYSSP